MDDAIRGGIIREEEIPRTYTDILGHSSKERLNTMIHDIVAQSQGKPSITMSEDVEFAFRGMRRYMFDMCIPIRKQRERSARQKIQ